jgi:hypothetical protein
VRSEAGGRARAVQSEGGEPPFDLELFAPRAD